MKIKKSTLLGKYSGGTWGFKQSFWVKGIPPPSVPLARGNPASDHICRKSSYWTLNFRKVNSFDSLNNKKQLEKMWQ